MSKFDEKKANQGTRTPLSVILDMAKSEISCSVFSCMESNHIPPALIAYVVKDILLDIYQVKAEQIADEFIELQRGMNNEKLKDEEVITYGNSDN